MVQRLLQTHGYTVIAPSSIPEVLRAWQENAAEIDLLLTDVVMPEMSGKELSRMTGLRTVFMSGYAHDMLGDDGVIPSDSPFIQKPFTTNSLLKVIRRTLDGSPVSLGG